ALAAVTLDGRAMAVPISQKCMALYYRRDLVRAPPDTLEALPAGLRAPTPAGHFLLVYQNTSVYGHAPLLGAFGGRLLTADDHFGFVGPEAAASVNYAKALVDKGWVPPNTDGALVTSLFRAGQAAYAISGPWLASSLSDDIPYGVAVLPKLAHNGARMRPLLTVEALMLSPKGAKKPLARALVRHLASARSALIRMRVARTVSARSDVTVPDSDTFLKVFQQQAQLAEPMPTSVAMRAVWEPARKALRKVMDGRASADDALAEGKRRFASVRRPALPPASPTPLLLLVTLASLWGAWRLLQRARSAPFRQRLRASLPAYRYLLHALVVVGLLVFVPLFAGAALSLYAGPAGQLHYVGLGNFIDILSARGGPLLATGSFYLVLIVTVLWTAVNLLLHLAIGMALGIVLSRPKMRLRSFYRVLLIVPWAVPNYVTALAWKGMFHRQFGAVTALTHTLNDAVGLSLTPISWFSQFSTAFTANVATNVWLGFPFMMVVTMAAMTSVPHAVLEAAEVDGASRWQRFRLVTLPLLWPSMLPAAVLGAIWTFNMFNVVFLVSGGAPDGQTDILVSEAYRWAFTRQAQYGYAAAYAVLIFLLLFGVTKVPGWIAGRKQRRKVRSHGSTNNAPPSDGSQVAG
ncbi:MAG TPA: extracellular solute-binding protein, partial [Sorangium sp.]|nr:extracellular solute-binding protein [Sorangium sp.]